ncbi:MAG: GIN domain-containing protein, partial [Mucilaginibacter sp.]
QSDFEAAGLPSLDKRPQVNAPLSFKGTVRGIHAEYAHKLVAIGSGKIYALDFVVGNYDIQTTGASECQINVLHELNVNTTGAADIKYRGNPTNVNSSKTGSASITKIN